MHQKFKLAEIPRTFHLQNDRNKSNLLIVLKYFAKFPVRQSISCEQSSRVHGEKDGLGGGLLVQICMYEILSDMEIGF